MRDMMTTDNVGKELEQSDLLMDIGQAYGQMQT